MRCIALFILSALALAAPARAQPVEVDVELVLMVDVSRSMSPREMEIQRRGYADALRSDEVVDAIGSGLIGQVAVTFIEWAGAHSQNTIIDWRLLRTRADAEAFADDLRIGVGRALRRTSISGALAHGSASLAGNGYAGLRRVIDISGDGPNNTGPLVTDVRDAVVGSGIVVNGLPLMTQEGTGSRWHLADLDLYYEACVIGGPGAFVIPVTDWDDFAGAVRRKLVLELVGRDPMIVPAQFEGYETPSYDCLAGEKMWRRSFGRDNFR
ncbi:DUF1194 domain-containing protein [Tranquillimonas rosea]|uniref:DUF1194 domain-containing protein n=1 Tax=Tranquillimonas rosea TaxID=641238 RepID=UPI003BABB916